MTRSCVKSSINAWKEVVEVEGDECVYDNCTLLSPHQGGHFPAPTTQFLTMVVTFLRQSLGERIWVRFESDQSVEPHRTLLGTSILVQHVRFCLQFETMVSVVSDAFSGEGRAI